MRVAAVVLAAGESRRLGRPKQLVPYGGRTLLQAVVREARESSCREVLVVVGANSGVVRPSLEGLRVAITSNPSWTEGMASSIRCGVSWAEGKLYDGVVLLVCDQPALTSAHVDRLLQAHAAGASIVASRYAGTLGVPALFGRAWFPTLMTLRGQQGGKRVIQTASRVAAVDWPEGATDIDTPGDAARLPL